MQPLPSTYDILELNRANPSHHLFPQALPPVQVPYRSEAKQLTRYSWQEVPSWVLGLRLRHRFGYKTINGPNMYTPTVMAALIALAAPATAARRFAMYYDQWHTAMPSRANTAGITHVILAFAPSTVFNSDPPGWYAPFVSPSSVRPLFDAGTQVCMAVGGWGDTAGFSVGQRTDASRKTFAKAVASVMKAHGYDCVGEFNPK